jgi:pimeloyl-ACP methyl ester carboxylesterase
MGQVSDADEVKGRVRGHVRTETAHIHFRACGSGAPLVLLHGNGEDSRTLRAQITAFRPHFRVIAIDSRGHGKSTAGSVDWDFPLFGRDVLAVLDELGIEQAHIFCYSDGGNTALQLVSDQPQRLLSVVVVGANLDPSGLETWTRAMMTAQRQVYRLASRISRRARSAAMRYALMLDHPHIDPVRLRSAHVPALVMAGERDVIRRAHTELIARSLRGARLEILRHAGHDIPTRHAAECNRLVLEFLA